MLFPMDVLERIASGEVTLAFRRWRRPPPTPGSTLRTAIGVLSLDQVQVIDEAAVSERDAKRSGAPSRAQLLSSLPTEGTLFRIELRYLGNDPREVLRNERLSAAHAAKLLDRLRRSDARAPTPWTQALLRLVEQHPGRAARELATLATMDVRVLKRRMLTLKELGLTESLSTGYRLSPRGQVALALLRRARRHPPPPP